MGEDEYVIDLGHLGWSQHRGGLDLYAGNDPKVPRAQRTLLWEGRNVRDREGASVLVVVMPGRFASNHLAARCASAIITALQALPDEPRGEATEPDA